MLLKICDNLWESCRWVNTTNKTQHHRRTLPNQYKKLKHICYKCSWGLRSLILSIQIYYFECIFSFGKLWPIMFELFIGTKGAHNKELLCKEQSYIFILFLMSPYTYTYCIQERRSTCQISSSGCGGIGYKSSGVAKFNWKNKLI